MARRNKLMKFAEMLDFPNVYQVFDPTQPVILGNHGEIDLKGKWAQKHFNNNKPICLELACGRGEYSLGLARLFPDTNFIGLDVKGARIWKGATTALNEGLSNVAFLRTRIEIIEHLFAEEEISEIWITFPDPFIHKINRRLTSPNFLNRYKSLLQKEHTIHLKTDSIDLYEYTMEVMQSYPGINLMMNIADIYSEPDIWEPLKIKTYYEYMHLKASKKITYVRFSLAK